MRTDRGAHMRDWSKADWVDPSLDWKPLPVSDMPERLLIDFATRCNLRCHMCPVWGLEDEKQIDDVKGIMNLDAARKMLDEFAKAQPMVAPSHLRRAAAHPQSARGAGRHEAARHRRRHEHQRPHVDAKSSPSSSARSRSTR